MKIKKFISIALLCTVFFIGMFAGKLMEVMGILDPPADPANTSSYTLEDIYNRLASGTAGSETTFTEPSAGPGTSTLHNINDIMTVAPLADNVNGATADQVVKDKTFWSLRTDGTWGLQAGTGDANHLPENILWGVTIFGVTGSYSQRFVDNGDETITDTQSGLMWRNSGHYRHRYEVAKTHCENLVHAGYSDWRLPTNDELYALSQGSDKVRASTPGRFLNIHDSEYYTITTHDTDFWLAWLVNFKNGGMYPNTKANYYYVLPVRTP